MEFSVLGSLAVRAGDQEIPVGGAKRRALLCLLLLNANRVTPAERLIEHLWEGDPPDTAASTLQSHVYNLRRAVGADRLQTRGTGYVLEVQVGELDAAAFEADLDRGQQALARGDAAAATQLLTQALDRWRGPAYDEVAGASWVTAEAARLEEARVVALETLLDARLAEGAHGDVVGRAEAAVAEHPLREHLWAQLMTALYRDGRQAEALRAYQRVRTLLGEELGIEPGAELRSLELAVLAQDPSLGPSAEQPAPAAVAAATAGPSLPSGVVTFLLTDIVGSSRLWEVAGASMPDALRRHGEAVAAAVAAHDGILLKPRGEGDSTFSVFRRASDGAAAALDAQARLDAETWPDGCDLTVRMALHTGEAFERDGDFFGPALNRAARIRSLAGSRQILVSQAVAELVQDHLPSGATLRSLGHRELRDLSRGEHVYELLSGEASVGADVDVELEVAVEAQPELAPLVLPDLPPTLVPTGPFVGRADELERLLSEWEQATAGSPRAAVVGGEPGVGKTRLAAEQARRVHDAGGLVLYGRCDEDLGAPYQPFAEALRTLLPCVGADRLRALRGVEELGRLVPEVADLLTDLGPPTRTDSDTERYALFDAVARLLASVSAEAPVLLVLDDLQWASKPTLLLLRHVLRNTEQARLQLIATYRTTDLDPAHPLASTLADLHRDGSAVRLVLGGLGEQEVTAYLDATGYEDEDLATALVSVTSGNPFFLIEVLRHLDETGGRWDPSTLPQGVREAVGRRLARLSSDGNDALLAGAVIGARFALDLVEQVVGRDLVEAVSEACDAELIVEEPGGWFRFNHALVRRSLLASVPSVKRVRLHQRIADQLEARNLGDDGDALAELAHHYFESAWAGNAVKAIEYCRRAADQAMADVAYEAAADFYDRALQAMDIDDRPADDAERAEVLLARCEALLAAGDVVGATDAVARLEDAAAGAPRLAAWATCFAGQLAVLTHPDQLNTIETAVAAAAEQLAAIEDDAGEAKAHTVRAFCLARLGRYADCETTLDRALTAARRAGDHRRVNAVLAGAPLAALWGPSPVARAGGRCLDVIRLLRITTGSPAVEATSVRCQAVLEAFRGRAHAARRMLESARRTLAELGLRHALYEVDLFVGIVELVDGKPTDAEAPLRRAFDGFRRMGVDADAAQAAALLARAYLEAGNDVGADELCGDSERLAGHDLKAAIAWRAARAQLLSRRGDHAAARVLADAAVALADRTDAFVDHGDAYTVLARVLEAAGDTAGAKRAADAGIALYERKGAVALADLTRRFILPAALHNARPADSISAGPPATELLENSATAAWRRYVEVWHADDWSGLEALIAPDVVNYDRRSGLQDVLHGRDAWAENNRYSRRGGGTIALELMAVRGDRLCLFVERWTASGDVAGAPEVELLLVVQVDGEGRMSYTAEFDRGDEAAALADLEARFRAGDAVQPANAATRAVKRHEELFNARDWTAMEDLIAEIVVNDDRRTGIGDVLHGRAAWIENQRVSAGGRGTLTYHTVLATRDDNLALVQGRWKADGDVAGAPEVEFIEIIEVDAAGRIAQTIEWYPADLAAAYDELEARHSATAGVQNAAVRIFSHWNKLFNERDWDGLAALVSDEFVSDDRRSGVRMAVSSRAQYVESARTAQPGSIMDSRWVATRGDRLALRHQRWRAARGPGSPELEFYEIVSANADGLMNLSVLFDLDDLAGALAELDALADSAEAESTDRRENEATEINSRWMQLFNGRDWDGHEALLNEDFSMDDRRRGVRLVQTRSDHVQTFRIGEVAGGVLDGSVITTRGDRLALIAGRWRKTEDAGAPDLPYLLVVVVAGGGLSRLIMFDPDDLDGAIAELDALHDADQANQSTARSGELLRNQATDVNDRWCRVFIDRDWDAFAAIVADDFVSEDRRSGIRTEYGRAVHLESTRTGDRPGATIEATVVATRGDRLALVERRWRAAQEPGAPEVLTLLVIEARDATLTRQFVFEAQDLDAAFAELDRLYLEGEGAPFESTLRPLFESWAAYNARDWERYRASFADDMVLIDHHSASMGTIADPDEAVRALQAMVQLVPGMRGRGLSVLAVDHGAASFLFGTEGATPDGVTVDTGSPYVTLGVTDGKVSLFEIFSEDGRDAALARFEQLRRGASALENASSRARRRAYELLVVRDWAALGELYREDAIDHDRRRLILTTTNGRDAIIDSYRATQMIGMTRIDEEALAVRGERLALIHTRGSGDDQSAGAFEGHILEVSEVDETGRFVGSVFYDQDAIEDAYEELERRYIDGEAAPFAKTWSTIVHTVARVNREGVTALPDSYMGIDHRALALPDATPESWISLEARSEVAMRVTSVIHLAEHGAVVRMSTEARSADEVAASWAMVAVITMGETGRIELFAEADVDAAAARFEELRPVAGELANAASRARAKWNAGIVASDWAGYVELLHPDIVVEDRRSYVHHTLHGREAVLEYDRGLPAMGVTYVDTRTLAIRGERLALTYIRGGGTDRGSGAYEGDALQVTELGPDGLVIVATNFDGNALDAAYAELDARYVAGEAAPFASTWQQIVRVVDRLNAHDLAHFPAGIEARDHRQVSFPTQPMEVVMGAMIDLVPNWTTRIIEVHRLDVRGAVVGLQSGGTTTDGADVSWSVLVVITVGEDARSEVFPDDQLDAAIARFDELRPVHPELSNSASRAHVRWAAAIIARDWEADGATFHEDVVVEDRRSYMRLSIHGRDEIVAYHHGLAEMGVTQLDVNAVALRGDRLSLTHLRGGGTDRGAGAYEGEALLVTEVDGDGLVVGVVNFDGDAFDAAYAEMEHRYLAGEGARFAHVWRPIAESTSDISRSGLAALPDLVLVDHSHMWLPTDDARVSMGALLELVPDLRWYVTEVLRVDDRGAAVRGVMEGTDEHGGHVSWCHITLIARDGQVETFPDGELDAALDRFEAMSPTPPELSNAATRARARSTAAILARDWRTDTSAFHEDAVVEDRRPYSRLSITGRDAILTYLRGVADMGVTHLEERVIAIRGERLSLTHVHGGGADSGSGGYEGDALQIAEVDADGLIVRSVNFDGDALDAAYAELEAWYLEGDAARFAQVWRPIVDSIAAINRHDLTGVPDVLVTDYTSSWLPTGDPGLSLDPLFELVPDFAMRIPAVHDLARHGAVFVVSMEGTDKQGAHVAWANITVVGPDGHADIFPDGDLDAALARFEELRPAEPELTNAATRANARWQEALLAQDWDADGGTYHEDAVIEDRRSYFRHTIRGPQSIAKYHHSVVEMGVSYMRRHVMAVRGERLSLVHIVGGGTDRGQGAYEGDSLELTEVDADGLIVFEAYYDGDALDAAFQELDDRYLDGGAAPHAAIWRPVVESIAAVNRHELDGMTETVVIDRSHQWMPTGDARVSMGALFDLVPNLTMRIIAVHRLDQRGAVFASTLEGVDQQGAYVAWSVLTVVKPPRHSETFDDDQLDAAIERFEAAEQS